MHVPVFEFFLIVIAFHFLLSNKTLVLSTIRCCVQSYYVVLQLLIVSRLTLSLSERSRIDSPVKGHYKPKFGIKFNLKKKLFLVLF